MNRRRIAAAALIVVAATLGLWWALARNGEAAARLEVSGTVEATEVDLGFQLPGRIRTIAVREGEDVAPGDVLATLATDELEAEARAARARLAAAEARLRELRSGGRAGEVRSAEAVVEAADRREEEARREAERARRLHEGGAISRQALDRAETAATVARSAARQAREQLALVREGPRPETIQAQEAAVEQARAGLERVEATLADGIVRAPIAGVVTVRHREPGETVPAGAPVLTVLDRTDRWVRIYVPGDRIGRVSLGQAAEIRSDTWPDRVYPGRVRFIGSEAEFTPRNVQTAEERTRLVYPVEVRITDDPRFELKPGIPADVVLLEGAGDAS